MFFSLQIASLLEFEGDVSALGTAEVFIVELAKIPWYVTLIMYYHYNV